VISQEQLARLAGVSRPTVSKVLNNRGGVGEEVAKRVLRIAREMNFVTNPQARRLRSGKTETIGLCFGHETHSFHNYASTEIIGGAREVLSQKKWSLLLLDPGTDMQTCSTELKTGSHMDGAILAQNRLTHVVELLRRYQIPFVTVNAESQPDEVFVGVNNVSGARAMVHFLGELGHRRIAFLSPRLEFCHVNLRDRWTGYVQGMADLAAPVYSLPELVEDQIGEYVASMMKKQNRPTAIVCSDDYTALKVMRKLLKQGHRIPQDVSVVGYNDMDTTAAFWPSLTTMRIDFEELGRQGMNLLFDLIDQKIEPDYHELHEMKLVVRESAGPPLS
jgi:LacI family transcriptional regulator